MSRFIAENTASGGYRSELSRCYDPSFRNAPPCDAYEGMQQDANARLY